MNENKWNTSLRYLWNKKSVISAIIFFGWGIFGIITMCWPWFHEHWYFSILLLFLILMTASFLIDENTNQSNAAIDRTEFDKSCDSFFSKFSDESISPSPLNCKFKRYLEMIRLIDAYKPRMKSKQTSVIVFFCVLLILLTVASIFSKDLDNKYVFFGGAFLALTYKVIDMMNSDTKTAFDKKTAYIDKLIDINFELEKNGQPCEERKLIIDSLVKNIVK